MTMHASKGLEFELVFIPGEGEQEGGKKGGPGRVPARLPLLPAAPSPPPWPSTLALLAPLTSKHLTPAAPPCCVPLLLPLPSTTANSRL